MKPTEIFTYACKNIRAVPFYTHARLVGFDPATSSEVPQVKVAGEEAVGGVVEARRTVSDGCTIPLSRATLSEVKMLSPVTIKVRMFASLSFFSDSVKNNYSSLIFSHYVNLLFFECNSKVY